MGKKLFKIFSVIFLLVCIGFYGYRLMHYYKKFNTKEEVVEKTYLYKKIISNSYINKDLLKNNEDYVYNYENTNNYVKYSGLLWQILSISESGEIKMVSKDNLLVFPNTASYDESSIKKYLEDEKMAVYRNLESIDSYLVKTKVCVDKIENPEEPTCESVKEYTIGIPSITDYTLSGGVKGFIKSDYEFWLSNMKDDERYYYVNSAGEVKTTKVSHNYGIKIMITLSNEVYYSKGDGSIENPYYLGERNDNFLNQKYINEYVSFNNQTWKIIDQSSIGTKIMLDGVLEDKRPFDTKTNLYDSSAIYKYLNDKYYNSIDGKDKIVKGKFYTGYYNSLDNYDYNSIYSTEIETYVGLPNMNDLFIMEYTGIYTMTPISKGSKTIYVLSQDKSIYTDRIHVNRNIRPVIYLNANLKITDGNGSKENPYVLE